MANTDHIPTYSPSQESIIDDPLDVLVSVFLVRKYGKCEKYVARFKVLQALSKSLEREFKAIHLELNHQGMQAHYQLALSLLLANNQNDLHMLLENHKNFRDFLREQQEITLEKSVTTEIAKVFLTGEGSVQNIAFLLVFLWDISILYRYCIATEAPLHPIQSLLVGINIGLLGFAITYRIHSLHSFYQPIHEAVQKAREAYIENSITEINTFLNEFSEISHVESHSPFEDAQTSFRP